MSKHRLRTEFIVAADDYIRDMVNSGRPVTISGKMIGEVVAYLDAYTQGEATLTDTELAIGWLIQRGRIGLRCAGTNAWARHHGTETLTFDTSHILLDFDDVPIYKILRNAELVVSIAQKRFDNAQRELREAKQELFPAYDEVRAIMGALNEAEAVAV